MPLVAADETTAASWESYGPSPSAVLAALAKEAPAAQPAEDVPDEEPVLTMAMPVIDRSMTDTASLLRELSGLFHADDPAPTKPTTPSPRPAPAPAPPKKKKGLFGRG